MTKADLEKQLRKCEKLLKKYTKCSQCLGKGKHYWAFTKKVETCLACHGTGTLSCELSAYWADRESKK